MIPQYLVAGLGNIRAVFLEAGEDNEIALVDHLAAVLLDVAIARRLLFRRTGPRRLHLLGKGRSGGRQEGEGQDRIAGKLAHEIFHSDGGITNGALMCRDGFVNGRPPRIAATKTAQARQMRLN